MLAAELLAGLFKRNALIIQEQTRGLTHDDSLAQAPRANCLNWVLGHIADYRDEVLTMLGEAPLLGEAGDRYQKGSESVTVDQPGVLSLERLLDVLAEGQERIGLVLATLSEQALRERPADEETLNLLECLHLVCWHETYHVGQTELLRALAGKTGPVTWTSWAAAHQPHPPA